MSLEYSPIVLDSINHNTFPKVELYVKVDDRFTLYKQDKTDLTANNIERLKENGTEFIYINNGDSEQVQSHVEQRLDDSQAIGKLSQHSINLICSQILVNCIDEVFQHPDQAYVYTKCRALLSKTRFKFDSSNELIQLCATLENNFDKYLITHSTQTTILSMFVCEKLFNPSKDVLINVGIGAMVHDIGMLNLVEDIIQKTDALSEKEYFRVKLHTKQGVDLLHKAGVREQMALDITMDHHERYDGRGYPRGLQGARIPAHAMLVAICDIYCALTMERRYKAASTPAEALQTLKSERLLFDPEIFDGFLAVMTNSSVPEAFVEEERPPLTAVSTISAQTAPDLRKKMREWSGDRRRLLQLHSDITDSIKHVFGEERVALVELRAELKDLLNSLSSSEQKGLW